jgi:hypothetical protein
MWSLPNEDSTNGILSIGELELETNYHFFFPHSPFSNKKPSVGEREKGKAVFLGHFCA